MTRFVLDWQNEESIALRARRFIDSQGSRRCSEGSAPARCNQNGRGFYSLQPARCELGIRAVCHRIVLSPETGPTSETYEALKPEFNRFRLGGYDEFRIRRAAHPVNRS
jgi:hypothetical protein